MRKIPQKQFDSYPKIDTEPYSKWWHQKFLKNPVAKRRSPTRCEKYRFCYVGKVSGKVSSFGCNSFLRQPNCCHRGKRRIRFLPHADSFIVIWIRNQNSPEDFGTLNFGIIWIPIFIFRTFDKILRKILDSENSYVVP